MAKQSYSVPLSMIIKEHSLEIVYTPCPPEERMVASADINRPGLALSGYLDFFDSDRIQVMGKNEHSFLENMPTDHPYIELYNQRKIIICAGQGPWEEQGLPSVHHLKSIFSRKGIEGWVDLWGYDVCHDWPW